MRNQRERWRWPPQPGEEQLLERFCTFVFYIYVCIFKNVNVKVKLLPQEVLQKKVAFTITFSTIFQDGRALGSVCSAQPWSWWRRKSLTL
jgi:hypothetical protein